MHNEAPLVVAGHICLDIIPPLPDTGGRLAHLLTPGSLVNVGPAVLSTGGAVSNTGLALHRLGLPVRLMGKVGDDQFGAVTRQLLARQVAHLGESLLVARGEPSSYTVVLEPPGVDRMFLHYPGPNDTFCAEDVPYGQLAGARVFHFGYPPIMRRFYAGAPDELARLFRQVQAHGVTTSLDMARPDPASPAGKADWRGILARALPHVDLFLPSCDEIVQMLRLSPPEGTPVAGPELHVPMEPDGAFLSQVGELLLAMGAGVVGLKLGAQGLYVRTSADPTRLERLHLSSSTEAHWRGRELLIPCRQVQVAGTTGCGDCTIAGFLAALARDFTLEQALLAAVAAGACAAERPDATSGVPDWEVLQARLRAGWHAYPVPQNWTGWVPIEGAGLLAGPQDRALSRA